ncbi:DUF2061 domain-containing protein [Natrinema versiforme]|uniref:DUF2061 domain-containing protein n=1 Tax=Natrinema versiforme TaxID=88724 RepID=UPI000A069928|nr:DUF2061 domain-containing protein [Natrinema versiforme]
MLLIAVTITWVIIGDVSDAINIGLMTNSLKPSTYYLYERTWDRITWGVTA